MKPTAAPAYFPYTHHRTMNQVIADEQQAEFYRLPPELRRGRTLAQFKAWEAVG